MEKFIKNKEKCISKFFLHACSYSPQLLLGLNNNKMCMAQNGTYFLVEVKKATLCFLSTNTCFNFHQLPFQTIVQHQSSLLLLSAIVIITAIIVFTINCHCCLLHCSPPSLSLQPIVVVKFTVAVHCCHPLPLPSIIVAIAVHCCHTLLLLLSVIVIAFVHHSHFLHPPLLSPLSACPSSIIVVFAFHNCCNPLLLPLPSPSIVVAIAVHHCCPLLSVSLLPSSFSASIVAVHCCCHLCCPLLSSIVAVYCCCCCPLIHHCCLCSPPSLSSIVAVHCHHCPLLFSLSIVAVHSN